ncbi:TetR/AcrR family transcriptional regulator [Thiocapsa marina]|uniref:Regulatory protein TetR n=1 Tax=Thiocapsa marina 5811 TaxID=768671 RepID=F9UD66_9GAMM|nr:TetR/AcrR family transcriptional regulator [Thiocapsa marina]EGV17810.1 regulatory protein TetR [Thiocapsa marina 5811]
MPTPDAGASDRPAAPRSAGRGRPPDPAKHAAILAAARRLFFSGSIQALNIEAVARASGVSKVTVYSHFGDLQGLIRAVVLLQRSEMTAALDDLPSGQRGLRQALIELGCALMGFLSSDDYVALQRMLASLAGQENWLGTLVYRDGAEATRDRLAARLAEASARGDLRAHDSRLAAEQLLGMWQGIQTTGLLSGGCPRPNAEELRRRVECGVEVLLRAYAPEGMDRKIDRSV